MLRRLLIPLLITAAISTQSSAHETDQFTIPLGRDFAELGPYFDELMHDFSNKGEEQQRCQTPFIRPPSASKLVDTVILPQRVSFELNLNMRM